jgi:hypothetical protein
MSEAAVTTPKRPVGEGQIVISTQQLEIMSRAGASIRNPDVENPTVRSDKGIGYLQQTIHADPLESFDVECIRRVRLTGLGEHKIQVLTEALNNLELSSLVDNGLFLELEKKVPDEEVRRLICALFTYCNAEQRKIVLYMYREAAQRKTGTRVTFQTNELLEAFGYDRKEDGSFSASVRSQLHRDLMALHSTELHFERPNPGKRRARKVMFRSLLRIRDVDLDNLPRDFDLEQAAKDGYGCADSYTVDLDFFDEDSSKVIIAEVDFARKTHRRADDYDTRLVIFLASRLRKESLVEGNCVVVSKRALNKHLELFGANTSRNNEILWRTIQSLESQKFLLGAAELPGKRQASSIKFSINLDMMWPG